MRRLEEMRFHIVPSLGEKACRTVDPGAMRPCRRQNDKGMAIGHGAPVIDVITLALPQEMAGFGAVMRFQIAQPVRRPVAVMCPAGLQKGVGIVEDKAGRADEMPCLAVIDCPVIQKMLEKAAILVEGHRLVKCEDILDMRRQEIFRSEIGLARNLCHVHPASFLATSPL